MAQPELPKRWRRIPGRKGIYYKVPKHLRHLFDNKQTFKLGNTQAEAHREFHARTGGSDHPERPTTNQLLTLFLTEYAAVYLAEGTYRTYAENIVPVRRVFGEMHPGDIRPVHVNAYRKARMDKGLAAGTANREAQVLSSALSFGVDIGWIEFNPLKGTIRRRGVFKEESRNRVPTRDELIAFTTGTYESHHRPDLKNSSPHEEPICPDWMKGYVALKMISGLRKSQLLSIDLTKHWDGEALQPIAAKGGKDTVYRGETLKDVIELILGRRLPRGPLFVNRKGKQMTISGFNSAWQRSMKRFVEAGGEHFREHDIRHFVASEAETLEQAQKLLGHQTAKITAQVYRHAPENVEVLKK